MKKLLYIASLLFVVGQLTAQNEAILTQYTVQPYLLNPALSGFDDLHQIRMNYRSSWTGFPDAPNTYALNYNGPVSKNFGIGGQVLGENVASTFRYNVKVSYAFHADVNDFRLAGGFSTSFSNFRLRDRATAGSVFAYDPNDPDVLEALAGKNSFDAALGFHARYRNQSFVGLTFPSLISARLDEIDTTPDEVGGADNFILRIGQDIRIKERNFQVTPSVVISRVFGAPFRVDFNAVASFLDEQFVAGLGYRAGAGNDVGVLLGTKFDRLRLFYSYDLNFGTFQTYNGGSHEITLGFDFDSKEKTVDAARYE
ncbi:MAG: PorP/SprF family type IX secretion system membrane protein [Saprospiraceae bacterium]